MNVLERRLQLCAAGYTPIPLFGKVPPNRKNNKRKGFAGWEQTREVTPELLKMWAKTWPDAKNTGILTRLVPTLDVDILNEEAARALEDHVRERFEERGHLLVRIGRPPKRAIVFRTIEPFDKIVVNVTAVSRRWPAGRRFRHSSRDQAAISLVWRRTRRDQARGAALHPRG
jgi:Bifunctional DNA primase/polymerase, N-terminal